MGIAAAAVTVLGACGGGNGTAAADRSEIESLLVRHYKTPSCSDLTTAGRTAFGHPVEDDACASDIASQAPKDVSVSAVKMNGDAASAVADDYNFKLQKVDGTWLIAG